MDIDREFFSIVEQLGPMGDVKATFACLPSAWVQRPANSCGCSNDSQVAVARILTTSLGA
ncbi:MAG TPA: hypothetical protein VEU28_03540 [Actinomycetota bacterium]|nr:hypothetical protein [Actinomycetota bacterium]